MASQPDGKPDPHLKLYRNQYSIIFSETLNINPVEEIPWNPKCISSPPGSEPTYPYTDYTNMFLEICLANLRFFDIWNGTLFVWLTCFFRDPPLDLENNLRVVCLILLTVARGGTYIVEQPGSSLLRYYHRFDWLCMQSTESCLHLAVCIHGNVSE